MKAAVAGMVLVCSIAGVSWSADKNDPENVNAEGRPKFSVGSGAHMHCAIWHDGSGWHVRTTSPRTSAHQFSIVMQIQDGKVGTLKPTNAEKKATKTVPADYGTWNKERTQFQFVLSTAKNGEDGFDFDLSEDATSIKFTVKIDGRDATDAIIIGSKSGHPARSTFSLPAHPMREKKSK